MPMEWDQKTLMHELAQGKELTVQLRSLLNPCSSSEQRQMLLEKILSSYDKALSILSWEGLVEAKQFFSASESPDTVVNSSPTSECLDQQHLSKKRKTSSKVTKQIHKTCFGSSREGPVGDGHCWRKYGQKEILGRSFPRQYYRCTHRPSRGCLATKQVQRSDKDPTIFEVTYIGRHTCNQSFQAVAVSPQELVKEESKEVNSYWQQHINEDKTKQQQEMLLNFGGGLKVKAEDLDVREEIFPSFPFSCPSVESEGQNNIMGSYSPTFIMSPVTSESNYFLVSPEDMGGFGFGQSGQTSESELTEIISAPTSVSNSPMGNLEFPLDMTVFGPNLSFDDLEFVF